MNNGSSYEDSKNQLEGFTKTIEGVAQMMGYPKETAEMISGGTVAVIAVAGLALEYTPKAATWVKGHLKRT